MSTGKDLESDISDRIKDVMATRGMTLRALSDRAGVPYSSMQSYLLGKHSMPAPALKKIAEALEVSADWILSRRPAVFHSAVLDDAFSVVIDFFVLSSNKISSEEAARMFINFYNKFYEERFLHAPRARERVDADVTQRRKKKSKRLA